MAKYGGGREPILTHTYAGVDDAPSVASYGRRIHCGQPGIASTWAEYHPKLRE